MFTPQANFSNIIDEANLYVSSVVHKSYVEIDAEGPDDSLTGNEMTCYLIFIMLNLDIWNP